MGGFYLLDCKDLDEALEFAAKIPDATLCRDGDAAGDGRPRLGLREQPLVTHVRAWGEHNGAVTAVETIERVFREESGRILATLIRACGDFDLAEEAMQEAFAIAFEHWPRDGIPDEPRRLDHDGGAAEGDRPAAAGPDVRAEAASPRDGCCAQRAGSKMRTRRK